MFPKQSKVNLVMRSFNNNVLMVSTIAQLMFVIALSATRANASSSLAETMCQAYIPVVEQALFLRDQGIPIGVAKDMADSAFDTNKELWLWLNSAIALSFEDPNLVRLALQDGRLFENCVQSVRGY
jgi:hypothetical protein